MLLLLKPRKKIKIGEKMTNFKRKTLSNALVEILTLKTYISTLKLFNQNQQKAMKKDISKRAVEVAKVVKSLTNQKNTKVIDLMLETKVIKLDILKDIINEDLNKNVQKVDIVIDCSNLLKSI